MESVKVICRTRPFNKRERNIGSKKCLKIDPKQNSLKIIGTDNSSKQFSFDATQDDDTTQQLVYDESCFGIVESVLEGYNATIFAYGQTGCGKSYTMDGTSTHPGIIPRSFEHIFNYITNKSAQSNKYLVTCSYAEIYCEEIKDLLNKDNKKMDLKMDRDGGFYIDNLTRYNVTTPEQAYQVFEIGNKARTTSSTVMNDTSSRSHSIFEVVVESQRQVGGKSVTKQCKLNLVDLAGSERQAKTHATGQTLVEAKKINASLSALGNVITALVDGKTKHIPQRDSKLTLLLKASLGGNAKTLMICALSPSIDSQDETLSTLRQASRAKQIQNKPVYSVVTDPKDSLILEQQNKINEMKELLNNPEVLKSKLKEINPNQTNDDFEHKIDKYKSNIANLKSTLIDKDRLLADTQAQKKAMYFKAQSEMNKLKKQRDEDLAKLKKKKKQIKEKYKDMNEELEAYKQKYAMLEEEIEVLKNLQDENVHDLNEDKEELKKINEDLYMELIFNKVVLYNQISTDIIADLRLNTQYDDINKNYEFPEELTLTGSKIHEQDKILEKIKFKPKNKPTKKEKNKFYQSKSIDDALLTEKQQGFLKTLQMKVLERFKSTNPFLYQQFIIVFIIFVIGFIISIVVTIFTAVKYTEYNVINQLMNKVTKVCVPQIRQFENDNENLDSNKLDYSDIDYYEIVLNIISKQLNVNIFRNKIIQYDSLEFEDRQTYCNMMFDQTTQKEDQLFSRNLSITINIFAVLQPLIMILCPLQMSSCIKGFGNCASSLKNCFSSSINQSQSQNKQKQIPINKKDNKIVNLNQNSNQYHQNNHKDFDLLSQNDNILMYKNAFDNNSDRQTTNYNKLPTFTTMTTLNNIKPKKFASINIPAKNISNIYNNDENSPNQRLRLVNKLDSQNNIHSLTKRNNSSSKLLINNNINKNDSISIHMKQKGQFNPLHDDESNIGSYNDNDNIAKMNSISTHVQRKGQFNPLQDNVESDHEVEKIDLPIEINLKDKGGVQNSRSNLYRKEK